MRAKFVNEKFKEQSDPIQDMGIGIRYIFNNLKKGDLLILIEPIDMRFHSLNKSQIFPKGSIIYVHGAWHDGEDVDMNYSQYKSYTDFKNNEYEVDLDGDVRNFRVWCLNYEFFKKHFQLIKRNVKFPGTEK